MSTAKVRAYSSPDAMKSEEQIVKTEESHDAVDNIIRQAIGKEPFLSFSRAGDNPVQWIQLLHALDQQGSSKVSRNSKVDNCIEGKEQSLQLRNGTNSFLSEMNGIKESKGSGNLSKGTQSTSEQMQTLKLPEAVVAFAQAAAKASGEPEKYLPGWPLLTPSKVQLQKCDKCSLEFCSAINYRRHTRVHRRSLNIVKDSPKNREFLGAFWDKLSVDEAKELMSFESVNVKEVTGPSVITALAFSIRKPGFSALPQTYVKAGVLLLDVVQARPSRFPITSQELFSALDDASEKTFLSVGTALSIQNYVFDGEVGKNALEMKNLVAFTSFLLEQILVKAWLADKDAEALRCQKLLMEEEEAAQKRQAELLERKRLKKLRQKEQKARDLSDVEKVDLKVTVDGTAEGTSGSTGTPSPGTSCVSDSNTLEALLNQDPLALSPIVSEDPDLDSDIKLPLHAADGEQSLGHEQPTVSERQKPIPARRLLSKPSRSAPNGFHPRHVQIAKSSGFMKNGNYRDSKNATLANGHKIWTRKSKLEDEVDGTNGKDIFDEEHTDQPILFDKKEVLIGSISVALGEGDGHPQHTILRRNNFQEKAVKSDSSQATVKLWRPVSRHGNEDLAAAQNDQTGPKVTGAPALDRTSPDGDHLASIGADDIGTWRCRDSSKAHASANLLEPRLFSSEAAQAFLAQRWKEAIAADHVKLVISPETEASVCLDSHGGNHHPEAQSQSSVHRLGRSILGSTENRMVGVGLVLPAAAGASKPKFRQKPEKSYRLKYVPKQRNNAIEE